MLSAIPLEAVTQSQIRDTTQSVMHTQRHGERGREEERKGRKERCSLSGNNSDITYSGQIAGLTCLSRESQGLPPKGCSIGIKLKRMYTLYLSSLGFFKSYIGYQFLFLTAIFKSDFPGNHFHLFFSFRSSFRWLLGAAQVRSDYSSQSHPWGIDGALASEYEKVIQEPPKCASKKWCNHWYLTMSAEKRSAGSVYLPRNSSFRPTTLRIHIQQNR